MKYPCELCKCSFVKKRRTSRFCSIRCRNTHISRKTAHYPNRIKRLRETRLRDNNPNWVGSKIGYNGIHSFIRRNKPYVDKCEECGAPQGSLKLDAANVSGRYLIDFSDWRWLCRLCHMKSDGRWNIMKQGLKNVYAAM